MTFLVILNVLLGLIYINSIEASRNLCLHVQIQELEAENSELKQQLQDLEEQLMIAHVPPVSTNLRT